MNPSEMIGITPEQLLTAVGGMVAALWGLQSIWVWRMHRENANRLKTLEREGKKRSGQLVRISLLVKQLCVHAGIVNGHGHEEEYDDD